MHFCGSVAQRILQDVRPFVAVAWQVHTPHTPEPFTWQVAKFNDVKVNSLQHLVELVQENREPFMRFNLESKVRVVILAGCCCWSGGHSAMLDLTPCSIQLLP